MARIKRSFKGYSLVALDPDDVPRVGNCKDCAYMHAYVSWWCDNEDAHIAHGTRIPDFVDCKFWKQAPIHISLWKRIVKLFGR